MFNGAAACNLIASHNLTPTISPTPSTSHRPPHEFLPRAMQHFKRTGGPLHSPPTPKGDCIPCKSKYYETNPYNPRKPNNPNIRALENEPKQSQQSHLRSARHSDRLKANLSGCLGGRR